MQDPISVTKVQPFHRHEHPTLDISSLKDEGAVFDDCFQIGVKVFEHKIEV